MRREVLTWAGVAGLALVSAAARARGLDGSFWIDEGLSAGIADHPLRDIPAVLRQDGSPPLYYLLLHVWMGLLGDGEVQIRVLSLLAATAMVPVAFWAGRALAGTRAGWAAAALTAVNPFIAVYAVEGRMYALVMLLALGATACLLLGLAHGRRALVPVGAALLVLALYTHNWALHLALALALAAPLAVRAAPDRRRAARDALLAAAAVVAAYLPWVPTLIGQARETGAPWSSVPGPADLLSVVSVPAGGTLTVLVLLAACAPGAVRAVRAGGRARADLLVLAVVVATVPLVAWLAAQVSPNWANRYFSVLVGPLVLLAAVAAARTPVAGMVAGAVVLVAWALVPPPGPRSNVAEVAAAVGPLLRPGDTVVVTHPEQIAVLRHALPEGLRWWTALGPAPDPRVFDWRQATDRLRAADPVAGARAVVAGAPPGGRVLVVGPDLDDPGAWRSPWTSLVRTRAEGWDAALRGDPRLVPMARAPLPGAATPGASVRATLWRIGAPSGRTVPATGSSGARSGEVRRP
jgi:hypothetical protein